MLVCQPASAARLCTGDMQALSIHFVVPDFQACRESRGRVRRGTQRGKIETQWASLQPKPTHTHRQFPLFSFVISSGKGGGCELMKNWEAVQGFCRSCLRNVCGIPSALAGFCLLTLRLWLGGCHFGSKFGQDQYQQSVI